MSDDVDRLTYTVPVVDDPAAARALLVDDLSSGWYARRRLAALTAALDFEKLHPRGPDGKFIEKFGFVRWLVGGLWRRGQVVRIDEDGVAVQGTNPDGTVTQTTFTNPSKQLYAVPSPKAQLDLPNPKKGTITPGFQKVGGQAGSNPGGFYTVTEDLAKTHQVIMPESMGDLPQPGDKLYVKTAKSHDHAKQELLANRLYEMAGVPVPDVTMGDDGITIASTIVAPIHNQHELVDVVNEGDTEMLQRIQEDMVVDAWLANWDVVGLSYDNMRVVDGVPYRLDAGGALDYRAQGGAKGNKFGNVVGELETLRDPKMNATAAQVFGGATTETLRRGAVRIAALSPEDIRAAVQELAVGEAVADKLVARRKDIMTRLGVPEPANVKSPLPEATTIPNIAIKPGEGKPDLNELVYDMVNGEWVPGTAVAPLQLKQAYNSSLTTWPGSGEVQVKDLELGDLVLRDWQLWRTEATGNKDQLRLVNLATGEEDVLNSSTHSIERYPHSADRENLNTMLHGGVATAVANDYMKTHGAAEVFNEVDVDEGPAHISAITVPRGEVTPELLKNVRHDGTTRDRYAWLKVGGVHNLLRIEDVFMMGAGDDNLVFVGTDMDGDSYTIQLGDDDLAWEPIAITNNDYTEKLLDAYFSLDDMQKAILDLDFPDEVPSVGPVTIDNPIDLIDPETGETSTIPNSFDLTEVLPDEVADAAVAATMAPSITDPTLDVGSTPQYPPVEYVSPSLPLAGEAIRLGEELSGSSAETLQIDLAKLNLVGRTFLFSKGAATVKKPENQKTPTNSWHGREGLFQITSAEVKPSSYGGPVIELRGINAHGVAPRWEFNLDVIQKDGSNFTLVPVDVEMKPVQPAVFKQDGVVVVGGMKVASFKKAYAWKSSTWVVTIDAYHSAYGVDTQLKFKSQKDAKVGLAAHIVPREILEPVVIKKHDSAKTQEQKFVGVQKSAGTLVGGDQAVVGQWVMSTKDGLVGKITGFPNLDKYPNDVWVTTPDGQKKSRKITMLKGVPNPSAAATKELIVPMPDVKLSDGTPVPLDAHIRAGITGKEIEGIVLKVNTDGYVLILDDASGKKMWRKASTGVMLEAPDPDAVLEMKTGASVSTPGKPIGAVKYPAPDGSILPSQGAERDAWVLLDRALTKDGYVPMVGMRVRDSKGQSLVVVKVKSVYDASPNSVKVYDVEQKKYMWRAVTGLHVDHAAELGAGDSSVARVKELFRGADDPIPNLPDGTVIYKVTRKQWVSSRDPSGSGAATEVTSYVVSKPTTATGSSQLKLINDNGYGLQNLDAAYLIEQALSVERVAMIDSSSGLRGQTSTDATTQQQKLTVFNPNTTTHGVVVNEAQVKELEAKLALAGGVPAKTVPATSVTPLPRPFVPDEDNVYPVIPQITMMGSGLELAQPPQSLPQAQSILGAVSAAVATRGSNEPGTSLHYGLGDSDLIEDMTVRTQIVIDDDGNESVELRFGLLEPAIDKFADQVLVRDGAKKGAWTQTQTNPKDLLPGDTISVRKSSSTGVLKPLTGGGASVPNATVAGPPKLIGQSTNGLDLYRVPVTFQDGSLGEVDAEQRMSPSITLHTFDFEKVQQGTGNVTLSPRAQKEGWVQVHNQMGYAYGNKPSVQIGHSGSATGIYLDENGRKHVTDGMFQGVSPGSRLRRTLSDGSFVDVNVAATAPDGRAHLNTPQRATVNGSVTIRVPLGDASDSELETTVGNAVSQLLEAVGVPPEKQVAPTSEQLTQFAINKVFKQYAKTYHHGKTTNASGDSGVYEVLDLINDAVGDKLGRQAVPSDIRFKVWDGGRVSVVVSDDVATAATKKQHRLFFAHSVYSSGGLESILSGTASGLMASDERWAAGVLTAGMSPGSDQMNDAANRVFLKPGGTNDKTFGGSHGMIFFAPRVINSSTDIYLNKHDGFGKHNSDNRTWLTVTGSAYELMYKRRLELAQIGFAVVNSSEEREKLIKKLKARGITTIGTRPVESVIVVSGTQIPPNWDAGVGEGGVEIPLPDVMASAPAEGAVVAPA